MKLKRMAMVLAVGAGTVTWAGAQNMQSSQPQSTSDQNAAPSEVATPNQPTKIEKASGLIGMSVENPQGDNLGKIHDIVINLKNDRVSYCVLEQGNAFFGKEKLLAVPLRAFQPSSDGSHLVLNATKDNIDQAQGFTRKNWPSVDSQQPWGAQPFWQNNNNMNMPSGTPRSNEQQPQPQKQQQQY